MASSAVTTRAATAAAPVIIVAGPLPPPLHGGAVATSYVLRSELARRCRIVHLDTTDRRGLDNIGRLDAGNVLLALRHCAAMISALVIRWPAAVYVPLALNRLGLLRDASLILPALALRRPVVLHLHGSGLREFHDGTDALTRALLRLLLGRATRVIVLGEALLTQLDGLVGRERLAVLPNGIEDAFDRLPTRRIDARPLRVLYLGNLRRAKGYHIAAEAVTMLRRKGIPVELHLAGGFSSAADRADGERVLSSLGDAAVLHGIVDGAAKHALLAQADVFVMPSYSEGHPYVLLEAMSAGLPIVASALPTIAETLTDGDSGLLVRPGDAAACAAALERVAREPELRQALGRSARRRFEERYAYEAWSCGLTRIIEAALA